MVVSFLISSRSHAGSREGVEDLTDSEDRTATNTTADIAPGLSAPSLEEPASAENRCHEPFAASSHESSPRAEGDDELPASEAFSIVPITKDAPNDGLSLPDEGLQPSPAIALPADRASDGMDASAPQTLDDDTPPSPELDWEGEAAIAAASEDGWGDAEFQDADFQEAECQEAAATPAAPLSRDSQEAAETYAISEHQDTRMEAPTSGAAILLDRAGGEEDKLPEKMATNRALQSETDIPGKAVDKAPEKQIPDELVKARQSCLHVRLLFQPSISLFSAESPF